MTQDVALAQVAKAFTRKNQYTDVLDDLSLAVDPGEFVAILGPSGCGKSTVLRLIAGLEQPTAGEVAIGGRPVSVTDDRCAVVFQEPRLLPWRTVAQNVALGARRRAGNQRERVAALLDEVGLAESAGAWPHQLSGGMAQRVALARGLAAEPDVLLLDEPFAALDALTRLRMQDLLLQVRERHDQTVVLVTHDIDEALYLADRIVILGGTPARVVATHRIPVPRPRDRSHPAIGCMRDSILRRFGVGLVPEREDTVCPGALAAD
ncbi:MAG TPA: ABC transporter ATP-binding protein [Thermomicrobiales bacterium]|nr:ABC transporter ATP-binding protein [Thermomicrobiales bacterium]